MYTSRNFKSEGYIISAIQNETYNTESSYKFKGLVAW